MIENFLAAQTILTHSEKFRICLGLERVSRILEIFKNPQDDLEFIHVAGTNGKGSTCAILSAILCEAARERRNIGAGEMKIGIFTSPHLFSYTERIKINNKEIAERELDELVNLVNNTAEKYKIALSEFEILTVAAFLHFKNKGVNLVVLEVGLGGRLDSTNVIKPPLVSVITSISLDHTARLGDTVNEIGFEKAGIIKTGSTVIAGAKNLALNVFEGVAKEKNALLHVVEDIKTEAIPKDFALKGDFQAENLALALKTLELLPPRLRASKAAIEAGLKNVRHKFRMELDEERRLLIDGCHNPQGAVVLRQFLDKNFPDTKIKFIYGTLNNKDYESVLTTLVRENDTLYFYEFNSPNSLKFEELPQKFKTRSQKTTDPRAEIARQKRDTQDAQGTLTVVCGSLYMLGEIFRHDRLG